MSKVCLHKVGFGKKDLTDIKGCTVCGLTDGEDEDGREFVLITFFNHNTKKCIQLEVDSDGEVFISNPFEM